MKILVADDEILVRIGLKSILEGCGKGYEVIEAEDGGEALEKYRESHPSLVFVDINMPKMDGLKFIEAAKKENYNSRFIILTCYTDFNYMREAIKIGIQDYIIKTSINNDELLRIALETEQEVVEIEGARNLTDADRDYRDLRVQNELKKAISKMEYDRRLLQEFTQKRNIGVFFDVLVASEKKILRNSRVKTIESGIINMTDELLKEYGSGYIFEYENNKYVILASLNSIADKQDKKDNISEFCKRLTISLKNYFNKDYNIGIIMKVELANIADAVQKAEETLKYGFYNKGPGFYFYNTEQSEDYQPDSELNSLKNGIADSLKAMEYNNILKLLNTYADNLKGMRSCRVEKAVNTFFNVFYLVSQHIEAHYPDRIKEIYDCDTYYTYLLECDDIYQIVEIIKTVIDRLINISLNAGDLYYEGIAQKARDYIDWNIEKDISLQVVSQHVGLSPSHFSKVFKDITGLNFIDYCIMKRVEQAKAYINEGIKVYIAAEKVGYNNYSYFSRLFKKTTGMTPEEYKKKIKLV